MTKDECIQEIVWDGVYLSIAESSRTDIADRWKVCYGSRQWWHMSQDAYMPNGVCVYGGYTDGAWMSPGDTIIQLEDAPFGVLRQIIHMIREDRELMCGNRDTQYA